MIRGYPWTTASEVYGGGGAESSLSNFACSGKGMSTLRWMTEMIKKLDDLVEDISGLNSKLILLIAPPRSGKSDLLGQLAERRRARVFSVGVAFGRELLTVPSTRRHLLAADLLKELADGFASRDLLLLDNIELLFDRTLQLSPLDLLRRYAHARRVVAAWPGELQDGRLSYAATGHPEHQDYGIDGLVPFKIR